MENIDLIKEKDDVLKNLMLTKEIIERNVISNRKLLEIKTEIMKTRASSNFIGFGILGGYITFAATMGISNSINGVSAVSVILGLILATIVFFYFKNFGKKYQELLIKKRFEKRKLEIDALNSVLSQTFDECEKISILPEKYRTIQAVEKIIDYFINKRADNLKEALNLYEDESMKLKQMQMLNNISQTQQSIIQNQKATNNQLLFQGLMIAMRK